MKPEKLKRVDSKYFSEELAEVLLQREKDGYRLDVYANDNKDVFVLREVFAETEDLPVNKARGVYYTGKDINSCITDLKEDLSSQRNLHGMPEYSALLSVEDVSERGISTFHEYPATLLQLEGFKDKDIEEPCLFRKEGNITLLSLEDGIEEVKQFSKGKRFGCARNLMTYKDGEEQKLGFFGLKKLKRSERSKSRDLVI